MAGAAREPVARLPLAARRLLALLDPYTPYGIGQGAAGRHARQLFRREVVFEGSFPDYAHLMEKRQVAAAGPLPELAFLGRSNVGKSSLINALLQRRMALTSSTPGRTRAINVFRVGNAFRLVDLPGYGHGSRQEYMETVGEYMRRRKPLQVVCQLIDGRHGFKDNDDEALDLLVQSERHVQLVLNKCDVLTVGQIREQMLKTNDAMTAKLLYGDRHHPLPENRIEKLRHVIAVSAEKRLGLECLCTILAHKLGLLDSFKGQDKSLLERDNVD